MPSFLLEMALSELVDGVFTLDSGLDGPDLLSDLGAFAGTYDDITADVDGPVRVEAGTDSLASGRVLSSSLTATVTRPDDPGYWNPNNAGSPLNSVSPGFEPFRPGRLRVLDEGGDPYGVFYGFLSRPRWQASTRSCQLYFEDLLWRLTRVYPVIPSTGPTTTGAAIGLILDAAGWTWPEFRELATGDSLDGFSADGARTARDLLDDLIVAERGTIFVRGDGVFVYESRDQVQTRVASWTLSTTSDADPNPTANLEELESGLDGDSILTRATVTRTDPGGDTTWTSVDEAAEQRYGVGEAPGISSPYIPAASGQDLADDLVYTGVHGRPPIMARAVAHDTLTLVNILSTPLQSVLDLDDRLGGTDGDFIVQRIVHTIDTGPLHTEYTLTKRAARAFALDSALDGPDVLRY